MDKRVVAEGLQGGLRKSLAAHMWNGQGWSKVGDLLAEIASLAIRSTEHTCPYCRRAIDRRLSTLLTGGPSLDDVRVMVEGWEEK